MLRHYMFNKLLVLVMALGLNTLAYAANNNSNSNNSSTEHSSKYEREDDFLYEEKIEDLVVDPETGQLVPKPKLEVEDQSEQEFSLSDSDL